MLSNQGPSDSHNTLCCKRKYSIQPSGIISIAVVRFQQFLVWLLLSDYAIEMCFNFQPRLFNTPVLPWETLRS